MVVTRRRLGRDGYGRLLAVTADRLHQHHPSQAAAVTDFASAVRDLVEAETEPDLPPLQWVSSAPMSRDPRACRRLTGSWRGAIVLRYPIAVPSAPQRVAVAAGRGAVPTVPPAKR